MTTAFLPLALFSTLLGLLQLLAALIWVAAIDPRLIRSQFLRPQFWGWAALGLVGFGLLAGLFLGNNSDESVLAVWGRIYMSLLHLQLLVDLFVVAFVVLLRFWPKAGGVALAAFREGLRQPM